MDSSLIGVILGLAVWGIVSIVFDLIDKGAYQECARIHQVECEQVWQPVSPVAD